MESNNEFNSSSEHQTTDESSFSEVDIEESEVIDWFELINENKENINPHSELYERQRLPQLLLAERVPLSDITHLFIKPKEEFSKANLVENEFKIRAMRKSIR